MQTQINERQEDTLKDIIARGGRVDVVEANFDLRTIRALENRQLVSKSENSKGIFVKATAKGKKFID
jgi:predicted MarR family transcription regulator